MTLPKPQDSSAPNALYVLAHPLEHSLNRELYEAGIAKLAETHTVSTSDLYSMGFHPLLGPADVASTTSPESSFLEEWDLALRNTSLPADVRAEQQKLFAADLIVIQFPLWWYQVPAMLKGWIDRVFGGSLGSHDPDPQTGLPQRYGAGALVGKRALLVVTAGEDSKTLGSRGISGDLDSLLFGLTHGTLFYAGIAPYQTHVVYDADGLDASGVTAEVNRLTARIGGLHNEAPVRFRTMASRAYQPERALNPEFAPDRLDLGIHRESE